MCIEHRIADKLYKVALFKNLMRWLIALMLFIFLVGKVSAQITCDESDRIFRVSSPFNSHGQVYNYSSADGETYLYDLCFSDYFTGSAGSGGHACTTANLLMNFSGLTNAHAEKAPGKSYNTGVCYNEFVCSLNTYAKGEECQSFLVSGKRSSFIVSFYNITNSHLSLGSAYSYSLCCAAPNANPICDYDNYCDEPEETPYNCPADCPLECVPDGILAASFEACDPNPDSPKSPIFPDDKDTCAKIKGSGWGGKLGCNDKCDIVTSQCFAGEELQWCRDNAPFGYGPLNCTGQFCLVGSCNEFNFMTPVGDREKACGQCSAQISADECILHPAASACSCSWDSIAKKCNLVLSFQGGLQCRSEWVSAGTCNPGDATRTINVGYTKISGEGVCPANEAISAPCPKVLQLPFFSNVNFILAAFAIFLIYFISYKRKNE